MPLDDDVCNINYASDLNTVFIQHASQADIDAYEWPANLEEIILYGDNVYELRVPDGVETVTCSGVPLHTLHLPDSVTLLYCENCCLKTLELPAGIIKVITSHNWLKSVTFRDKPYQLQELLLKDNRLSTLDFDPPSSLFHVDFRHNHTRPIKMNNALARHVCKLDDCEL